MKVYQIVITSSLKIEKPDTCKNIMLISVNDYVFRGINLSKRFADVKA